MVTRTDDEILAVRLSVASRIMTVNESIRVTCEIRNASTRKITILRPFGDRYVAQAVGLKIWSGGRRIRYTGANLTYPLSAHAFAVIGPGEVVEDKLEVTIDNFGGIASPGVYILRYDYAYDGRGDATAAAGNSGIINAWRGTISSREVHLSRK